MALLVDAFRTFAAYPNAGSPSLVVGAAFRKIQHLADTGARPTTTYAAQATPGIYSISSAWAPPVRNLKRGVVDTLRANCFPQLSRSQVYECLACYEDHRGEIDLLVARQRVSASE